MALLPGLLQAAGQPAMAAAVRSDPVLGNNFLVSLLDTSTPLATLGSIAGAIGDVALGGFSECSGLEMSMTPEEYKEGGNNGTVLKFPSRMAWGNLTLKRGMASSTALWDWHYGFVLGRGKRRDGLVVLLDARHAPQSAWFFSRDLPVKYTGPALNASQNSVAIETLELAHEGILQIPFAGAVSSAVSGATSNL